MTERDHPALLVVDVQNDFCTGGSLAVPESPRVIAAVNRHLAEAAARGMPVYASRDWHPPATTHFSTYGGQWPVHCVQGSHGAAFHPELELPPDTMIVTKGERDDSPGYSAFDGHLGNGRPLLSDLRDRGVTHLYVAGLATDYCVKHSVMDALAAGLRVTVLEDAIAGVDVAPGDSAAALADMRRSGADVGAAGI